MFYYVTYAFQSESTLYSCLKVKEPLARSRRKIWRLSDCNWTQTGQTGQNGWVFVYKLSGCGFEYSQWSFCSAEFTLLLLFSEFLITALFVIYSSPSMFAKSQLRSFSSVIPSKYIHCLYTFGIPFFVWKVLYQGSFVFIKTSRISFTVSLKIFTIYSIYHFGEMNICNDL